MEDGAMRMVVKVDSYIDAGNPAQHHRRRRHKGYARPRPGNSGQFGVLEQPKSTSVSRETKQMERYAMPVLGMGQKETTSCRLCVQRLSTHNSFRAAVTAAAVTARLIQGPQSAAPRMITIAKSGKNDRPRARRVCSRNV